MKIEFFHIETGVGIDRNVANFYAVDANGDVYLIFNVEFAGEEAEIRKIENIVWRVVED